MNAYVFISENRESLCLFTPRERARQTDLAMGYGNVGDFPPLLGARTEKQGKRPREFSTVFVGILEPLEP
ncbi:MAG TPA: hypothetical protein DCW68_06030 [Rhodospirillaceae bacterium]|nr:MAG: hypothetical protein A2018_03595 [Alphaproteobacteria bacterium GWF2_58_20]HAU29652.1 hypothetical protein [Rhodospirillaceae bacterium]